MSLQPAILKEGTLPDAQESFCAFLLTHPLYKAAFDTLSSNSRVLATSAQLVFELHGGALGPVADEILSFVDRTYPAGYVDLYLDRLNQLRELQRRFDRSPNAATLGDPGAGKSQSYGLALLLSIVLTNNRFEIMQALCAFLQSLQTRDQGLIACIGAGTGYELKLAAELLRHWQIETYDTDSEMRSAATQLLQFFGVSKAIDFRVEFPLDGPTEGVRGRYDALVLCEVAEHLTNPQLALNTLRECLRVDGRLFVTMAINIAQEDHVFLYPDIESCRRQLRETGFQVQQEWISPQTILFMPENREQGFKKGNYIAIVGKAKD